MSNSYQEWRARFDIYILFESYQKENEFLFISAFINFSFEDSNTTLVFVIKDCNADILDGNFVIREIFLQII